MTEAESREYEMMDQYSQETDEPELDLEEVEDHDCKGERCTNPNHEQI